MTIHSRKSDSGAVHSHTHTHTHTHQSRFRSHKTYKKMLKPKAPRNQMKTNHNPWDPQQCWSEPQSVAPCYPIPLHGPQGMKHCKTPATQPVTIATLPLLFYTAIFTPKGIQRTTCRATDTAVTSCSKNKTAPFMDPLLTNQAPCLLEHSSLIDPSYGGNRRHNS